jgi:hypothetical protein
MLSVARSGPLFNDIVPPSNPNSSGVVRVDFANTVNKTNGYVVSLRVLDYQGLETYCDGTGNCASRLVTLTTASGFDGMTGIRSPRPWASTWRRSSPARRSVDRRPRPAPGAGRAAFDTPAVTAYKTAEAHLNSRFTSRADLAAAMLQQLTGDQYVRKTMAVATVELQPSIVKLIWREGISKSLHRSPRPVAG